MKFLIISLVLLYTNAFSQSNIPVSEYLNEIASGNTNKVKMMLPDLMVEYPNDAGVKLLTAAILSDAMKALEIYNEIVNESPQSEWADDALYRIIQFNVVLGNNETALNDLNKLRQRYPTSEYIIPSADLVKTAFGVKESLKSTNYANINENSDSKLVQKSKKEEIVKNDDIIIIPNNDNKVEKEIKTNSNESQVKKPLNVAKVDDDEDTIVGKDDIKTKEPEESPKKVEKAEKGKDAAESLKNILNKQMEIEKNTNKNDAQKQNTNVKENASKDLATNNMKTEESEKIAKKRWGLQVAIYESKESAEKEKEKFLSQRMRTEVIARNVDNKLMYAVVVGNYSTKANAEAAKIIINQQCNCNPLLLER